MRKWVNGENVYASDLHSIVAHGNLVFADAAARNAFLVGEFAPVPGMVVYLESPDAFGGTQKRVTVGNNSYWVPPPGTTIVGVSSASGGGTITSGVATQMTGMTAVRTRNAATMWANDRFTPTLPGWYELDATVRYTQVAADGFRATWLSLNGASAGTAMAGSWNQLYPGWANSSVSVPARTVMAYFNGIDGSYVTLMGMHNSTSTVTAGYSSLGVSAFYAKYLGL
jgi:hypothetical protein